NHFLKIQYLILNNNKPEKQLFHYLKSLAYVLRMFLVLQTMFEYHSTYIRHLLKFDNEQSMCLDVHQFALCTLATIHHSYFQKELDFRSEERRVGKERRTTIAIQKTIGKHI